MQLNLFNNLKLFLPELFLLIFIFVLILLDLFAGKNKKILFYFSLVVVLIVGKIVLLTYSQQGEIFFASLVVDNFSIVLKFTALVSAFIVILMSKEFFQQSENFGGEYLVFILTVTLGIMLLCGVKDLISLFICMELVSITSYILVGYVHNNLKSAESSLKYFLLGATTTAAMLYGMSFIYGLTGETNFSLIAQKINVLINQQTTNSPHLQQILFLLSFATIFLLAGFGFKLALVPFHMWAPDAYEGAPTPVAAFLSIAPKIGGTAALIRLFTTTLIAIKIDWSFYFALLAVLSMTLGNTVALVQDNIKRMLAYSSIAQLGYIMIAATAMAILPDLPLQSIIFYLICYLFMNLGAFALAEIISSQLKSDYILDYSGLSQKNPYLAFAMAIFLLSLIGLPPLAGFIGKFYLFAAAVQANLYWLVLVGIINSVISVYYYVGVIKVMYLDNPINENKILLDKTLNSAVIISLIFTILIGIFPTPILALLEKISVKVIGGL